MNSKHLLSIALSTTIAFSVSSQFYAACCLQTPANYPLPPGSIHPQALAFSPSASFLATTNETSTNNISLFKVNNGILDNGAAYTLPSGARAFAFSPAGPSQYLAITSDGVPGKVTIYRLYRGLLQFIKAYDLPSGSASPISVAYSPNGSFLATANVKYSPFPPFEPILSQVTLFKVINGELELVNTYSLPSNAVYPSSIAFSSSSSYLATANFATHNVTLFRIVNGALQFVNTCPLPAGSLSPISLAFLPNNYLATANYSSNNVTIFSLGKGGLTGGTPYPLPSGSTNPISVALNGSCMAVANESGGSLNHGGVTVYTVATNGTLTLSAHLDSLVDGPKSVALSSGSTPYVATANYSSNNVSIFKTTCI